MLPFRHSVKSDLRDTAQGSWGGAQGHPSPPGPLASILPFPLFQPCGFRDGPGAPRRQSRVNEKNTRTRRQGTGSPHPHCPAILSTFLKLVFHSAAAEMSRSRTRGCFTG